MVNPDEFWERVQKSPGCWTWTGSVRTDGRARFFVRGRGLVPAHRIAWELTNGSIPSRRYVRRTCENPLCVRPQHLVLATAAAVAKIREKRHRPKRATKLREADVRRIRAEHKNGVSQAELARRYGLSSSTICSIVHRRAWRHLE
jgi:hypothetical protein